MAKVVKRPHNDMDLLVTKNRVLVANAVVYMARLPIYGDERFMIMVATGALR